MTANEQMIELCKQKLLEMMEVNLTEADDERVVSLFFQPPNRDLGDGNFEVTFRVTGDKAELVYYLAE
jgi:hypothetical protein